MLKNVRDYLIILLSIGLMSLVGCGKSAEVTGPQEAPETAAHLWKYQLEALKASDKSRDALDRLSRLYLFAGYDPVEACEWDEIGAENGDVISQSNLALVLAGGVHCDFQSNRVRAWYWYNKLVASGDTAARQSLEQFPETERAQYLAERNKPFTLPQTVTLNDLKPLQERAWLGSADAALKLYDFHTEYRSQFDERLYWARIAAQNGSPKAQLLTAKLYLALGTEDGRVRAWFWLNRAAKTGNQEATELLRKEFPKAP